MKPFRNQKFEGTEVVLRNRTLPGTHPFWEEQQAQNEEPPPIKRWWDWVTLFSPKAAEEAIERFEGDAPRERETWERPL